MLIQDFITSSGLKFFMRSGAARRDGEELALVADSQQRLRNGRDYLAPGAGGQAAGEKEDSRLGHAMSCLSNTAGLQSSSYQVWNSRMANRYIGIRTNHFRLEVR
jgi:hypothetical protein